MAKLILRKEVWEFNDFQQQGVFLRVLATTMECILSSSSSQSSLAGSQHGRFTVCVSKHNLAKVIWSQIWIFMLNLRVHEIFYRLNFEKIVG